MDSETRFLPRTDADQLLERLRVSGFPRILGPVARDGSLVFSPIHQWSQLPAGIRDMQTPGTYRLHRHADPLCFAWANGPQALKPLTFAGRELLWRAERHHETAAPVFEHAEDTPEPTAVLGIRACDLAALALQEKHFTHGRFPDPFFGRRRRSLFLIAVHCSHPASTCFCASTGDGPTVTRGHDLVLAELDEGYLISAGSRGGRRLLKDMALPPATAAQVQWAERASARATAAQMRHLPGRHLKQPIHDRLEARHWSRVGERCLSCGNCTAVCPTCFCHMELDEPALSGHRTEHLRQWSSCFNAEHSYMGHFLVRSDTRLRYRQWLTHKLAGWHEQYGRSGCVGCGRCITWCPVGIDITAEVAALLAEEIHAQPS
ncbi:sulfite reductase subunit A [Ectothiorhodospira shaposhnikovii]|nr:sulfite reductase subunit A [Ectothiorhodospira shaposhnikovii]